MWQDIRASEHQKLAATQANRRRRRRLPPFSSLEHECSTAARTLQGVRGSYTGKKGFKGVLLIAKSVGVFIIKLVKLNKALKAGKYIKFAIKTFSLIIFIYFIYFWFCVLFQGGAGKVYHDGVLHYAFT